MLPADPAARAGSTPEASGDSSSGTFENKMISLNAKERFRAMLGAAILSVGVVLIVCTAVLSAVLNPRGIYGLSWIDPVENSVIIFSLLLFLISPFFTTARFPIKCLLLAGTPVAYGAALVIGYGVAFLLSNPLPN